MSFDGLNKFIPMARVVHAPPVQVRYIVRDADLSFDAWVCAKTDKTFGEWVAWMRYHMDVPLETGLLRSSFTDSTGAR